MRQTQRSPEGPRHLHRITRLSEAPWEVPYSPLQCGARGGFLPRRDEDLKEPLVRRQGSQVSMWPWLSIVQEGGNWWSKSKLTPH